MHKYMILLFILVFGTVAYACTFTKQCCRRNLGRLECVQVCELDLCPIGFDIEIR